MAFYRQTGELIFGTRLKRLSDRFLMDVARIYKTLDISFEIGWFPLFYLLNERGTLSVTEIARELEITHSAVSQLVASLEKKNLVVFLDDQNDKRRRLIGFTENGIQMLNTIMPIWETIQEAMRSLLSEGKNTPLLMNALDELEISMNQKNVFQRVMKQLGTQKSRQILKNASISTNTLQKENH